MNPAHITSHEPRTPDALLAKSIASGDHGAFVILMRRHNQALFRTARSILRDDAEAEDALQDAYLLAYRAIGSFRAEAKLSTWLVRIVVNEALGRSRRNRRRAEVIPMVGNDEAATLAMENIVSEDLSAQPERAVASRQTRRMIEARIDELPEAFRTVFVLRALEEMSVEEVAASLDIAEATVRSRFFRAKSLLRASLSREIDHAFDEAFAFAGERCDRIVEGVLERLQTEPSPGA
jgi:RNA polymerase sigma-70 factor (ECF subfamily)